MAAEFPSGVKSFAPIVDGVDYPQAEQVNEAYDEIAAVEDVLLNGTQFDLTPDATANARAVGTSAKRFGLAYVKGVGLNPATTLTVATGVVTATQGYHAVDTEGAAATDDLTSITAGTGIAEGFILVVRAADITHVVTVKDGGNLLLSGDYVLSGTDCTLTLIYDGTNWRELGRSGAGISSGVFTPVIGGSGGTSGQTYVTQVGIWIKVGKLVIANGRVVLSNKGTITTDVQLQGLPFTSDTTTNARFTGTIGEFESFNTSYTSLALDGQPNKTALELYGLTAASSGNAKLATANITNNTGFNFSVSYIASA